MTDYKTQYKKYLDIIEEHISAEIKGLNFDGGRGVLADAMKYSLLNGGKRIRPVLSLAVAEMLGVPIERALPFACAVEMIHTSSLIHDDLPALDNDDQRRGKPSNHKVFGEAMAVICGDALMNFAYEVLLSNVKTAREIAAARKIASCTGINGMLGGQAIDIIGSANPDEAYLIDLDHHKTARLIIAAVSSVEILSGSDKNEFEKFGADLGLLFQYTDDILDVVGSSDELGKSVGKDAVENKTTAVSVFGLDGAKKRADDHKKNCIDFLKGLKGSEFLQDLVKKIAERRN